MKSRKDTTDFNLGFLDPSKILASLGLHDDAARAAIKGAMKACETHGFDAAAKKLAEALKLVPRI